MKWCSECGGEHRDSATECVFCHGPLVDERPAPVRDGRRHDVASVDIAALDPAQRSMLRLLLTSSGVHAEFRGDRLEVPASDLGVAGEAVAGVQGEAELDVDESVEWHLPSVTDPDLAVPTLDGRPIASTGTRVGAWMLDWIIVGLFTAGLGFALERLGADASEDGWWVVGLVWLVQVALVARLGWTPGKLVIGLRVVAADGRPPGWTRAAARSAAMVGPYYGAMVAQASLGLFDGPATVVAGATSVLAMIWFPLLLWTVDNDSMRQGWHDHVAGTYVVER